MLLGDCYKVVVHISQEMEIKTFRRGIVHWRREEEGKYKVQWRKNINSSIG